MYNMIIIFYIFIAFCQYECCLAPYGLATLSGWLMDQSPPGVGGDALILSNFLLKFLHQSLVGGTQNNAVKLFAVVFDQAYPLDGNVID